MRRLLTKAANDIPASGAAQGLNAEAAWPSYSAQLLSSWRLRGLSLRCLGGRFVLETIQETASGFLHVTRSPRHGMLSSARQHFGYLGNIGLWCKEKPWFPFCSLLNGSLDVTTRNHWRDKCQGTSQTGSHCVPEAGLF